VRVLGIDLGRARTGLALSDPVGVSCAPLDVVRERDEKRLILKIAAVAAEEQVDEIVVGLPRPLGGGTNQQMTEVLSFVGRLEAAATVPVRVWDERFTSKMAERVHSRAAKDAVAACYMLQNYLDSRARDQGGS
jgi:putative Holliday junction resolvase